MKFSLWQCKSRVYKLNSSLGGAHYTHNTQHSAVDISFHRLITKLSLHKAGGVSLPVQEGIPLKQLFTLKLSMRQSISPMPHTYDFYKVYGD